MKKPLSKKRIIVINITAVIISTIIAIITHAILPGEVNVNDFDSIFVRLFGFEIVATLYFLLLFVHCALIISYFGKKSIMSGSQIGIRFGLSFALIYMLGMQEIVVESSPFSVWGIDFVKYQLLMGLSDAIPVFLLCTTIGYFTLRKSAKKTPKYSLSNNVRLVFFIALIFTMIRTICYQTGVISSNCNEYPLQCFIWTVLFGITLGFIYVYLRPIYSKCTLLSTKLSILTIGLNWIIFNCFIGLILKGVMPQMLLRSSIDTTTLFVISILLNKYGEDSYEF